MSQPTAPATTPSEPVAPAADAPAAASEETPVQAATTPVATPEAPAQPRLGAGYAKLAREQKVAREEAQKVKAERVALEKDQLAVRAFQEAKANAKRFPLKALQELGLTYEDLVEAQLNDGQPTPNLEVKAIRDEVEALKRERDEERKRYVEEQKRQADAEITQTFKQFDTECSDFVQKNADKYELTTLYGQSALVAQVVKEHWEAQEQAGVAPEQMKLLSVQEAAEEVEKALEQQAESYRQTKKFTAKAQAVATPPPPVPVAKKLLETRTLSNQLSGSSAPKPTRGATRAEREKRADALLESLFKS